ncbi:MAG: bifunctional diaminohydroxyphosphoribosylaminopyrimidine deaminase/5-amino-6-(5-phosphoribosylamino)uracil reductase RibD [Lentisphaerae bacterium]|nr:bifunctional diaminohydroxyphosphoribosylaminopyrimidine deaminase/5-amino-6-(5-phosphoribosylamino)uracil reductase RibD [Lentisphaerota bacterium]
MKINSDSKYMSLAISLAKRAWGQTSPNPMVGAVIVKNGRITGKGYHRKAGDPHAEINAINSSKGNTRNSTLYVTLEPCCTFGRTPPCTNAIMAAGIKKVVVGCLDPNPRHAGKSVDILRKAGITVSVGIKEKECIELNEAFFHWITTGRPFILLKMAMTLDGKIATHDGKSKWITGAAARRRVQKLRQWADAIMVGAETARTDKPSLTVREFRKIKQPRRLIVSRNLTDKEALKLLPKGVKPEIISASCRDEWTRELKRLGKEGVVSVLAEGGGELAASLLEARMANKIEFHIAPKILGGRNSRTVVGGENPSSLAEAFDLQGTCVRKIGDDLCISGYPETGCARKP